MNKFTDTTEYFRIYLVIGKNETDLPVCQKKIYQMVKLAILYNVPVPHVRRPKDNMLQSGRSISIKRQFPRTWQFFNGFAGICPSTVVENF